MVLRFISIETMHVYEVKNNNLKCYYLLYISVVGQTVAFGQIFAQTGITKIPMFCVHINYIMASLGLHSCSRMRTIKIC